MNKLEPSLRLLVEKWLAPTENSPARVVRFGHTQRDHYRYVCIEAFRSEHLLAIFFFRHDDGSWQVFPPEVRHLTLGAFSAWH
ncbi:MAG: hypothetical protein JO371_12990 [Paraburkholderia sp.]|nr:hypothetical protein [Paraburkholderia sp.]